MKNIFYLLISLIFLGCSGSIEDGENMTISSGSSNNKLGTLSVDNINLDETLTAKKWKTISANLDEFYTSPVLTQSQEYTIDMSFNENQVLAYADCQKLTARYRINDKKITFYNVQYTSAIELATCQESKDADRVVYEFMLREFEATEIKENEIKFNSYEADAEIILSR